MTRLIFIVYRYNENIMTNMIELRFRASDLDSIDPSAIRYVKDKELSTLLEKNNNKNIKNNFLNN